VSAIATGMISEKVEAIPVFLFENILLVGFWDLILTEIVILLV